MNQLNLFGEEEHRKDLWEDPGVIFTGIPQIDDYIQFGKTTLFIYSTPKENERLCDFFDNVAKKRGWEYSAGTITPGKTIVFINGIHGLIIRNFWSFDVSHDLDRALTVSLLSASHSKEACLVMAERPGSFRLLMHFGITVFEASQGGLNRILVDGKISTHRIPL